MLLIITYSQRARQALRNLCNAHEESVVRRFGRAALLAETEHGAFLALRLREKHPEDVQLERTIPFNEFRDVPEAVRDAVADYEARENRNVSYQRYAAGRSHPSPAALKRRDL